MGVLNKFRWRWDSQKRPARILFLLGMILVVYSLSGCSTGRGGRSRGSVTEAVDQAAADETPGRGTGRTRTKDDHQNEAAEYYEEDEGGSFLGGLLTNLFFGGDDDDDGVEYYSPPPTRSSTRESASSAGGYSEFGSTGADGDDQQQAQTASGNSVVIDRHNLILWLSRAHLGGDTIEHVSTVTLMYSGYHGKRTRMHFGLYYGEGRKGSQARVQDHIRSISEFGIDLGGREYLTPSHTLVGLYLLYGARAGALRWTYNLGIRGIDGGETINNDAVFLLTPYLGLGTSIVQVKPLHLGASLTWGPRFTLFNTFEDFENDLFRDVGEVRLNLELSIFF